MSLGYLVKGFFRFITFLLFFGIILLGFLFAVNNTTEVILWVGFELPPFSVGELVIIVFIVGGLLGLLLGIGIFKQMKHLLQIRKLRSQIEKLQGNAKYEKS